MGLAPGLYVYRSPYFSTKGVRNLLRNCSIVPFPFREIFFVYLWPPVCIKTTIFIDTSRYTNVTVLTCRGTFIVNGEHKFVYGRVKSVYSSLGIIIVTFFSLQFFDFLVKISLFLEYWRIFFCYWEFIELVVFQLPYTTFDEQCFAKGLVIVLKVGADHYTTVIVEFTYGRKSLNKYSFPLFFWSSRQTSTYALFFFDRLSRLESFTRYNAPRCVCLFCVNYPINTYLLPPPIPVLPLFTRQLTPRIPSPPQ